MSQPKSSQSHALLQALPRTALASSPFQQTLQKCSSGEFVRRDYFLLEQEGKCNICGNKLEPYATERDHKIPLADGGRDDVTNLQLLCSNCHCKKTRRERHARRRDGSEQRIWSEQ